MADAAVIARNQRIDTPMVAAAAGDNAEFKAWDRTRIFTLLAYFPVDKNQR